MSTAMSYTTAVEETPQRLDSTVNLLLSKGWKIAGPVYLWAQYLCQPMVLKVGD